MSWRHRHRELAGVARLETWTCVGLAVAFVAWMVWTIVHAYLPPYLPIGGS